MNNLTDVKLLLDAAFAALAAKGVNVTGVERSQLAKIITDSDFEDCTQINQFLTDELGEPVTDVKEAITKLTALKNALRQAIVAKGTLVLSSETLDRYAQKIRAIRSYADLTFSGVMPNFILDPEPTGSTIVYMKPVANGTGDGTSWENAMSDFVAAHASLSGTKNVIYMEEGVYPATGTISLKTNIKIYGGFKANDHSWNARNGFENRTILDAQLTELRLIGNSSVILDSLTVINARNSVYPILTGLYYSKNLIIQDCQVLSGSSAPITNLNICSNVIALNCSTAAGNGGGFGSIINCNNFLAINCRAVNGGGIYGSSSCNNLLLLNCYASNQGGGANVFGNCANVKIINCSAGGYGGGSINDNNCKNFLILNCIGAQAVYNTVNCQNYTVANCICSSAISHAGGSATPVKLYNCVCFNNKSSSGSLVGISLVTANYYYKVYNCRADAAISFVANAATNADIQNFYLIQNNNAALKFTNTGMFPIVGTLPYENMIVNNKYVAGDFGNWSIPADSVLAGAGYWEDGFSFGWDIDGKPRNATHCSIGAYEPNWA